MAARDGAAPVTTGKAQQPGESENSDLGSAAAEAARLIEALRHWADDRGFTAPSSANVATGSPECKLCPFCQALSLVRENHPDVIAHLGVAAENLLAAARSLLSDHEAQWSQPAEHHAQHIDIDE